VAGCSRGSAGHQAPTESPSQRTTHSAQPSLMHKHHQYQVHLNSTTTAKQERPTAPLLSHLTSCQPLELLSYASGQTYKTGKKGKGFPYSLPSVGPRADPGVQAVTPTITRLPLLAARPAVTFPAAQRHRPLAGTKLYCSMHMMNRGVNPGQVRGFAGVLYKLRPLLMP